MFFITLAICYVFYLMSKGNNVGCGCFVFVLGGLFVITFLLALTAGL